MTGELNIEFIKTEHDRLYTRYSEHHLELMKEGDEHKLFIDQVNSLLENIKKCSTQTTSIEDHNYLTELLMIWQTVFQLEFIKTEHDRLYTLSSYHHLELMKEGDERNLFIEQVNSLLENIKKCSTQTTSIEDYNYLTELLMIWQTVFLKLKIPGNIQLLKPKQELASISNVLTEEKLKVWVQEKAYYIGRDRKDIIIQRFRDTFLDNPSAILDVVSNPDRFSNFIKSIERDDSDWFNANVHLASCIILNDSINFTTQISSESYWRLEQEWLDDVKRLIAYYKWLNTDRLQLNRDNDKTNYVLTCEDIRNKLVDRTIKASQRDFKVVRKYLESKYLTDGEIDLSKGDTKELIARKAYRLYSKTGQQDSLKNWVFAENYVRQFYKNIISAVDENNYTDGKTLAVLQAVSSNNMNENPYLIINCFEAALCTYFLQAEIVEDIWNKSIISKDMTL